MIKLTDLELCKKIAEIEGVPIDCIDCIDGEWLGIHGKYDIEEYNPFEWSLLGPLMVKYEVCICRYYDMAYILSDETDGEHKVKVSFSVNGDVGRAILECIVEANS